MIINNLTLAYLCNDLPNAEHYKIDGGNCYYKDSFIGEIREELEETVLNIYFTPISPVKYVQINFTIKQ
jgi:hypothetical protein